jgi:hypothetical protein
MALWDTEANADVDPATLGGAVEPPSVLALPGG